MHYQSTYGQIQPRYRWLCFAVGLIGVVGVPLGIFWNKDWAKGNRLLQEPWAAITIIEIVSIGALAIAGSAMLMSWRHSKRPLRVAIDAGNLVVPKSIFSSQELVLPLAEVDLQVFNAGFVKQLQIKHGRRKLLLTSALFPSDEEFDQFVGHLL